MYVSSKALVCAICLSFGCLSAQVDSIWASLDTIYIKADRLGRTTNELLASGNTVQLEGLTQQVGATVFPLLQTVPGVFISNESNLAQDVRISVRGFGARSAFGIRGIKLIVDGVPETTPDGQGQLDNLDPLAIASMAVIKSPSASQFGNASSAVVQISTYSQFSTPYVHIGIRGDQLGTSKIFADLGWRLKKGQFQMTASHLDATGYRQHNDSKASIFSFRGLHYLGENSREELRWQISYAHSPQAQDPGAINLISAEENPRQARPQNLLFNADEEIRQLRLSTQYKKVFSNFLFESQAYFSARSFLGRLPFRLGGWNQFDRQYGGQSSQFTQYQSFFGGDNKVLVGYDLAFQRDHRARFNNNQGEQEALSLDQHERFDVLSFFVADNWKKGLWQVDVGLRYDVNWIGIKDNFLSDGDDSATIQLPAWSPSLALGYTLAKGQLFVNYHRSFETPTLTELGNNPSGQGGFNLALKPQVAHSIDMGGRWDHNKFSAESSIYHIWTQDEFLPYELASMPGRLFYRNAGRTERLGWETSLSHQLGEHWTWSVSASISQMEFADYTVGSNNFDGNTLPGIPQKQWGARWIYNPAPIQLSMSYQGIEGFYLNDANALKVNDYHLVDINATYHLNMPKNLSVELYIACRNLLNQRYFDNIRINASGGNYYEPGPNRRWDAGITLKF